MADFDLLQSTAGIIGEILTDLPHVLAALDYAGVGVFAVTGALVAARERQDIITCAFFATLTGIGGGTTRDLLIGAPVFWIVQSGYLEVCLVAALVVFSLQTRRWPARVLTWLDALGLSVYCVLGTLKALQHGVSPVAAAAMGVVTASVGGILRDVVAMRPSVLLDRELYITAGAVGAGLTVTLVAVGLSTGAAGIGGMLAALLVRSGAILLGWKLPAGRG